MAKVEMTLQEYNEIHDHCKFLEGIVTKIMTGSTDDWSMNYYKENQERTLMINSNSKFNKDESEYLQKVFDKNIPEVYKGIGDIKCRFDESINLALAEITHYPIPVEETEEDTVPKLEEE